MSNMNSLKNNRTGGDHTSLKVLVGGMLGMVVAMGIGRFAFTPILPLMQRDLGLSNSSAGWLAATNYLGYLIGATLCSLAPQVLRSRTITGMALITSIATTLCMGLTLSTFWWEVMRLGGGIASAILFIIISSEVAETLSQRGHSQWFGALYSGIGLGIALSGLMVPWFDRQGGWATAWLGSGCLAIVAAWTGLALGRQRAGLQFDAPVTTKPCNHQQNLRPLVIAYFLEGLGYIVTATFIVAIIARTPGIANFAPYSWVAVGLAAAPSTLLWPLWAKRVGNKTVLLTAFCLQAAGILISSKADSLLAVLFSAVSFGATFLGIVAVTLAEGIRRWPADSRQATAILTTSFSLGQIIGPAVAGVLADRQSDFTLPLLLASACVMSGGVIILLDRHFVGLQPKR